MVDMGGSIRENIIVRVSVLLSLGTVIYDICNVDQNKAEDEVEDEEPELHLLIGFRKFLRCFFSSRLILFLYLLIFHIYNYY